MKRVAVIPGDGIGPEVIREAVLTIERVRDLLSLDVELKHFDWGAEKYLSSGITLPDGALEMFRNEYDAILTGAFGDPRVSDNRHAKDILLGLRSGLDLYINLRPIQLLDPRLCPLKGREPADVDFVVFRENTEGLYVFMGGNFKKGTPEEIATQEEINTRRGVERIIRAAFEYARREKRKRVTMTDKSNVLTFGHDLWQRTFKQVASEYSGVEANHLYVDVLTMWMVLDPGRFDVIVTNNLFGDIITDLGAALQGGLGMAASGNINPGHVSLFEPVHGSAPQFAGRNVSNPVAAISTAAMMLRYLGFEAAATGIDDAMRQAVLESQTTADIGGKLSTTEAGEAIRARLRVRA